MKQTSVVCETCGKVFSKKFGLNRHKITVHELQKKYKCQLCDKCYPRNDVLKRHILLKHTGRANPLIKCELCEKYFKSKCAVKSHMQIHNPENRCKNTYKRKGRFECSECGTVFLYRQNLIRHIQYVHTSPKLFECAECGLIYKSKYTYGEHFRAVHESNENLTCDNCLRNFRNKKSLTKHVAKCSKLPKVTKVSPSIICIKCEKTFARHYLLLKHYSDDHNVELKFENKQFDSFEEFNKWKQEVEFFSVSGYHSVSGVHETSTRLLRKFRCHRSGVYRSHCEDGARVRRLKKKGTKKLQGMCPAEIVVKEYKSDGKCEVTFQTTHVGHEIGTQTELSHIYLDKRKRLDLAAKIAERIPLTIIVENENESLINGNYDNRKRTITSKDLRNIKLHYVPNLPTPKRTSESISTFVEQNKDSVLYFKNKNEDVSISALKKSVTFSFQDNDFILIFMNAEQRKKLELLAENRPIGIEGTQVLHYPEKYNLHTLMVFNLNQESLPVAFLLTNREDETVNTCFLECIKTQVGDLKVKTLICDLQITYFESWMKVMSMPQFYLLRTGHVLQEWDRQCKKIPELKRDQFRSSLHRLLQELDENKFRIMLEDFIRQSDPDYHKFMKYFIESYLSNVEQWAYCYRMFSEVDTNNDLHFKFNPVEGKKVKTVATCLESIKNSLLCIYREEEMKKINGYAPSKLEVLNDRHVAAFEQMNDFTIYCLDEPGTWQVISSENIYTVSKQAPQCLSDCLLKCVECNNVCLHEFRCSCMDHSIMYNMCEHIHVVVMICKTGRSDKIFSETYEVVTSSSNYAIMSEPGTPQSSDTCTIENQLSKDEILEEVKQKFQIIEQNVENLISNASHWKSIKEILDAIPTKIMDISMNSNQESPAKCYSCADNSTD